MSTYTTQDVDSPTLLTSLRRYRTSSVLIIVGFGLLGAALTFVLQGQPTATATIGLRDPKGVSLIRSAGASGTDLARYTSERADYARSAAVVGRAAQIDGHITESDLRSRLTTAPGTDADVIKVSVKAPTAKRSSDLANAVAQAFEEEQQRSINVQLSDVVAALDSRSSKVSQELAGLGNGAAAQAKAQALSATLNTIESNRTDITVEAATFGSGVEFIDAARTPAAGVSKSQLVRNTLAGLIFGVFVAMFVAWMRASSARVIEHSDSATGILDLPLLGEIPEYGKRTLSRSRMLTNLPMLEYQFVSSTVSIGFPKGVLVVAGLFPGDGATTSAINLAAAAAVNGQSVLLIDADLRGDGLTSLLGLPATHGGVAEVLSGTENVSDVCVRVDVAAGSSITVLTAGSNARRQDFQTGERLWSLLDGLRADYDIVIVDAPPVLHSPDAVAVAVHADALALVIKRGTPTEELDRVHRQIKMLDERAIGYLFTYSNVAEVVR